MNIRTYLCAHNNLLPKLSGSSSRIIGISKKGEKEKGKRRRAKIGELLYFPAEAQHVNSYI